jgi:O-antigen/teichoic acid export membrane protein
MRLTVQAGTLLLLAHLLGPSNFAALAAVVALAVLHGVMSTFGTHLSLLRDLSNDQALRDDALPLALGTTALCSAVLLALYLTLSFTWFSTALADPLVIVCIGVSEILLQPYVLVAAMERHARGQVAGSQLLLASPQLLRLLACAAIWWTGTETPLQAYAIGHLVAVAAVLAAIVLSLPHAWPPPARWRLPNRHQWRENSGYAVLGLSGTGPGELDKALAVHLLPLGLAGIYAAASRVVGALVIPVVAVVLSAMPRLFREAGGSDAALQKRLLAAAAGYGLLAALVVWYSSPVVDWLFGPAYAGIGQTVRWLAFAIPGMALRFATMNVLTTVNLPWARTAIEVSGLALLAALAWWGAQAWSQFGFVLAVGISEWTIATLGLGVILTRRGRATGHRPQQRSHSS